MMHFDGLGSSVLAPNVSSSQYLPTVSVVPHNLTLHSQNIYKSSNVDEFLNQRLIYDAIDNFTKKSKPNENWANSSPQRNTKYKQKTINTNRNNDMFGTNNPMSNLMYNRSENSWITESFPSYSYKTSTQSTATPQETFQIQLPKHKRQFSISQERNNTQALSTTNHSEKLQTPSEDRQHTEQPPKSVINGERFPLYMRIWATIAACIVLVIGVVGNALVPVLVCLNKDLRHSTNLYLLNLAAADLLVLLVCLPTALVELHVRPETWVLGPAMCWLVPLVEVLVTRASVLTLVVISVERYLAICRPLRTTTLCSKPRAALVCALLWVLALASAVPTLQATQFMETEYHDGSLVTVCMTGLHHKWTSTYYLLSAGVFVLLPFLLLLGVYSLITCRLLLQRPNTPPQYLAMQQWKAKKQVSMMLGAVVVVFFFCLLPFQVLTVWIILSTEEAIKQLGFEAYYNLLYMCRVLLYINSAANPIIYNAMSSKFRDALLKLMGRSSLDSGKRTLRRQSTLTTSFSSSSFISLRRRASQVFSRTLSRKPDPGCVADSSAITSKTAATEANSANVANANLSEDDLQNQNYNSVNNEKSKAGQDNIVVIKSNSGEIILNEETNCLYLHERVLHERSKMNVEFCGNCSKPFSKTVQVTHIFSNCGDYCSSSGKDMSKVTPLNLEKLGSDSFYQTPNIDSENNSSSPLGEHSKLLPKLYTSLDIETVCKQAISSEITCKCNNQEIKNYTEICTEDSNISNRRKTSNHDASDVIKEVNSCSINSTLDFNYVNSKDQNTGDISNRTESSSTNTIISCPLSSDGRSSPDTSAQLVVQPCKAEEFSNEIPSRDQRIPIIEPSESQSNTSESTKIIKHNNRIQSTFSNIEISDHEKLDVQSNSDEATPVVVQIITNESSSPMLPRYTLPVRPPRGRRPSASKTFILNTGTSTPKHPKKHFVKRVSFKDSIDEELEKFTTS